ncbi:hypothetical protein FBEOM_8831 [Fusarium beomiforme]|uniref:Uncharacterized protein n=1 Tax=Fusarium beomiforme TaxID=44412 RepID=A0A9P5DWW9_9HYPO|nr:hypothetical protein FBEOM_8831 [Fusarium beomiforme]
MAKKKQPAVTAPKRAKSFLVPCSHQVNGDIFGGYGLGITTEIITSLLTLRALDKESYLGLVIKFPFPIQDTGSVNYHRGVWLAPKFDYSYGSDSSWDMEKYMKQMDLKGHRFQPAYDFDTDVSHDGPHSKYCSRYRLDLQRPSRDGDKDGLCVLSTLNRFGDVTKKSALEFLMATGWPVYRFGAD